MKRIAYHLVNLYADLIMQNTDLMSKFPVDLFVCLFVCLLVCGHSSFQTSAFELLGLLFHRDPRSPTYL